MRSSSAGRRPTLPSMPPPWSCRMAAADRAPRRRSLATSCWKRSAGAQPVTSWRPSEGSAGTGSSGGPLGRKSADRAVERLHRLAGLVVVREEGHDFARVGRLPPECLAKVVEDVATLFDPPAEVRPATPHDDAAERPWMIGAVDDRVFGQLAACPKSENRRV